MEEVKYTEEEQKEAHRKYIEERDLALRSLLSIIEMQKEHSEKMFIVLMVMCFFSIMALIGVAAFSYYLTEGMSVLLGV